MRQSKTLDMMYIALGAALLAVCAWITIPAPVPFTLQTFAVFAVLGILGGKRGTISILVYILLGAVGLPVFSGFRGGVGVLFGTTGGYIAGFVLAGLLYWLAVRFLGTKTWVMLFAMITGLLISYLFGSLWFMQVYMRNTGTISFMTTLTWCVFPFILPDMIKLALGLLISKRVRKVIVK